MVDSSNRPKVVLVALYDCKTTKTTDKTVAEIASLNDRNDNPVSLIFRYRVNSNICKR